MGTFVPWPYGGAVMWVVGLWSILSGCVGEAACPNGEGCSGDSAAAGFDDTAVMVYSPDEAEPEWTAEQIGEQIQNFVDLGIPNGLDVGLAFFELMSLGDGTCPEGDDPGTLITMPEGCDTVDGYHYAGIGWFNAIQGSIGEQDDMITSWSHGGDFEILRPDGSAFAGGGGMSFLSEPLDDGSYTFFGDVHGSWLDETRTDWLGLSYSSVIEYDGGSGGTEDSYWLNIVGGVGVGDQKLHFNDVSWDTEGTCAGVMTGAIHVRDSRGYWYVWDVGDDCDTCGTVTFHTSVDLGELCMDLTDYGAAYYLKMAPR